MTFLKSLALACSMIAMITQTSTALEASANQGGQSALNGLSPRLQALESLVTASYNDLTGKIGTCSDKDKLFSPANGSADADGCIDTKVNICAKADKLYMPNATGHDSNGCIALPSGAGVPTGTMAAFATATCPTGWSNVPATNGRFLVGDGSNGENAYTVGQIIDNSGNAGFDQPTLTASQMPSHNHKIPSWKGALVYEAKSDSHTEIHALNSYYNWGASGPVNHYTDNNAGGGQPFENRPKFLVVNWCMKN